MSNIIDTIQVSGVTYTIAGSGSGNSVVEVTQAQYDALVSGGTVDPTILYIITDAQAGDLTNYYTKTETNTLLNGKQATLVSGTNIKTINNESLLGSGNIDIQGGSTYIAGRGIDITNDTISFSLPISAGTGSDSVVEGNTSNRASGSYSHAEGYNTRASGGESHAEGYNTKANGNYSHVEGYNTKAENSYEHASGQYNVSSFGSLTFGDSGNTLFSVGNGTANNARHNAFEIRQNGDIYLSLNGQDVKLQDQLGGGGSITIDPTLDSGSTNPVENQALWDELRIPKNEEVETVLEWENNDGGDTTNYPTGASKLEFYIDENEMTEGFFFFQDDGYNDLGKIFIEISNGNISVTDYENVTYTISGDVVTVNYSSIAASVALISSSYDCNWTVKAYTGGIVYEPIIDQVSANTAALGGKVDTSAITTSISSSSTDAQVPSAKAVYESVSGKVDTSSMSGYVTTDTAQNITGEKTFVGEKKLKFKQSAPANKIGFTLYNSASTNNELATFEFRPNTYTVGSVQHPLLYLGHYRSTAIAGAGVPQTVVGFRQYDQANSAAYHLFAPLPEEAKTPFSLTTSFQNYFIPLGFKNGSTMIKTDNTGVADFSDVLGGLKLVKLTQTEYDNLSTKDSNTLYVIVN